jgi:TPR repeat protein
LQAGAKLGDEQCVVELARLSDIDAEERAAKALKDGAFEEAEKILKPLAERNSEYALLSLGWVYETGVLGVPDLETARSYYESAVAQGSSSACFELGRMSRGQGKEAEARSAFAKGAERGDVPSMSRLGRMMVEGKGGPADAREGAVWLERAAAEGHILAQRTLLGIEEKSASSLLEKLAVKRKIVSLMKRGAQEFLKDAQSDKVR